MKKPNTTRRPRIMFIINPPSGRGADNLSRPTRIPTTALPALEQMAAEMGIRSAAMTARAAAPSQNSGPWGQASDNAGGNSNGGSRYRGPWS